MESLQASLESEQRAKAEGLRIKKKLESDINEYEIALDHTRSFKTSHLQKSEQYKRVIKVEKERYFDWFAPVKEEGKRQWMWMRLGLTNMFASFYEQL